MNTSAALDSSYTYERRQQCQCELYERLKEVYEERENVCKSVGAKWVSVELKSEFGNDAIERLKSVFLSSQK